MVLANGCFDPLHYGHVIHLEDASLMGDFLVVGLTKDKFVNKGPGRPVFDEQQRKRVLQALNCVNEVVLCENALDALKHVKPDIFVKGQDYLKAIDPKHEEYCKLNNIEIRFTETPIWSSTALLSYYARSR